MAHQRHLRAAEDPKPERLFVVTVPPYRRVAWERVTYSGNDRSDFACGWSTTKRHDRADNWRVVHDVLNRGRGEGAR